ncbi:MAG: hypothetical protein J5794_04670 [Lachnospiraceae bacterium]|nr:hypothetical protein [Lachnospiraceae bacterium]
MKKIGFIDYVLDEWHANNYPAMIEKATNGAYKVCYAYAYTEPEAGSGLKSSKKWAEEQGVELLGSIEEVIQKSDCLVVLSPDNPEMHETLAKLPLESGKPTYIDKTFAPDKETAIRIFEHADAFHTPCWSSSALRFAAELEEIDTSKIYKIYSEGPASLEIYCIHQIEPIIRLMNARAEKIMFLGDGKHPSMIIGFEDGRYAEMYHRDDPEGSFRLTLVDEANRATVVPIRSDYFGRFIQAMIRFFETAEAPVTHEQTIDVIAVRTAAIRAKDTPFEWVTL